MIEIVGSGWVEQHALDVLPTGVPSLVNEIGKDLVEVLRVEPFDLIVTIEAARSECLPIVFAVDDKFPVPPVHGHIGFHPGKELIRASGMKLRIPVYVAWSGFGIGEVFDSECPDEPLEDAAHEVLVFFDSTEFSASIGMVFGE